MRDIEALMSYGDLSAVAKKQIEVNRYINTPYITDSEFFQCESELNKLQISLKKDKQIQKEQPEYIYTRLIEIGASYKKSKDQFHNNNNYQNDFFTLKHNFESLSSSLKEFIGKFPKTEEMISNCDSYALMCSQEYNRFYNQQRYKDLINELHRLKNPSKKEKYTSLINKCESLSNSYKSLAESFEKLNYSDSIEKSNLCKDKVSEYSNTFKTLKAIKSFFKASCYILQILPMLYYMYILFGTDRFYNLIRNASQQQYSDQLYWLYFIILQLFIPLGINNTCIGLFEALFLKIITFKLSKIIILLSVIINAGAFCYFESITTGDSIQLFNFVLMGLLGLVISIPGFVLLSSKTYKGLLARIFILAICITGLDYFIRTHLNIIPNTFIRF
jgi:hypothetical protein